MLILVSPIYDELLEYLPIIQYSPLPSHQLLRVEKYFIQTLKPKYNLQGTDHYILSHAEVLQNPTPQESRIVASLLIP